VSSGTHPTASCFVSDGMMLGLRKLNLLWRVGVVNHVHFPVKVKRKDRVSILHTAWFLKLWDATYSKKSRRVVSNYLKCSYIWAQIR
jgi:hypothetical protein